MLLAFPDRHVKVRETLYPGPELVLDDTMTSYSEIARFFMSAYNINKAIVPIYTEHNMAEMDQVELEKREPALIPHFSVHNLRHTFCTRLCEMTSDIKFIQQLMVRVNLPRWILHPYHRGNYAEQSQTH